jgi:transposase
MKPVIGLDISKAESHGQAFLDRGKPHGGVFCFTHTQQGLSILLERIQDLQEKARELPVVVLEATGHYQSPVVQYPGGTPVPIHRH